MYNILHLTIYINNITDVRNKLVNRSVTATFLHEEKITVENIN